MTIAERPFGITIISVVSALPGGLRVLIGGLRAIGEAA